jgi:hypothetical protein
VSLLQIPEGIGDLAQRVGPVDHRRHVAGLYALPQRLQIPPFGFTVKPASL